MTIDEAMNLIGHPWVEADDDSGYLVDGVFYADSDLVMDYDTSKAAATLGHMTSPAKKKSSAENGKKGGRPKKPEVAE